MRIIQEENDDEERTLWTGRFAARSMLGFVFGAAFVTVLIVLAVVTIPTLRESGQVWTTMIGLLILIWICLVCAIAYQKLNRHFEVTTQRLMHRRGILMRHVDRIELIDVDDVTYRQGPIQTLLNVGTITLLSSDTSHPNLAMPGIASVSRVAELIDNARRSERRKRGIHVESI